MHWAVAFISSKGQASSMKPGHTDKGHKGGKRSRGPQVGAALSLDKFASAKVSKYDKKQLLEKQRALRAKQINKYRKLQKRLAAEGKLSPLAADAVGAGADLVYEPCYVLSGHEWTCDRKA